LISFLSLVFSRFYDAVGRDPSFQSARGPLLDYLFSRRGPLSHFFESFFSPRILKTKIMAFLPTKLGYDRSQLFAASPPLEFSAGPVLFPFHSPPPPSLDNTLIWLSARASESPRQFAVSSLIEPLSTGDRGPLFSHPPFFYNKHAQHLRWQRQAAVVQSNHPFGKPPLISCTFLPPFVIAFFLRIVPSHLRFAAPLAQR